MNWLLIGVILTALLVFGPWSLIWALNTLFGLSIAFTFKTWLAVVLLCAAAGGIQSNKK